MGAIVRLAPRRRSPPGLVARRPPSLGFGVNLVAHQRGSDDVRDDGVCALRQSVCAYLGTQPQGLVDKADKVTPIETQKPDRKDAIAPRRLDRSEEVWRLSTGRDHDENVVWLCEVLELAGEHALVTLVVGEGCEPRPVVGETDDA